MARPMCLLLLDRDPERRTLVRSAMRRRADLVLAAGSPAEAWRYLEQSAVPIDRALIDIALAGDSAVSFAAELQGRFPEVGIVLSVDQPLDTEFRTLRKPYGVPELWAAMV